MILEKVTRLRTFVPQVLVCAFALSGVSLAGEKSEKWQVSAAHGPADTVTITVDEGTWMSLDVSPDGKEIVFDLLGDIFIMPVTGGEAKALRTGPAWEVQPRFSPDGTMISFTSDHDGGDNIWVMKRDGSDARAVTKENFRLLNNAIWTPDGQYLIARKHFTSRRSLGAGEMWMYHISGGKGLQLTKRKNDQQDAGEPALSPDGRYLFFSEDMYPGGYFQYNKNPYGQIYVIRRLDRETGKLQNYITGAGGAVRPQVSPDGRYLSFVRRVRLKSVLYIHDLKTGEQWPVYDQLDRDQQEAWAIFGVYPNYNWTPDGKAIIIWAGGKIRRVDLAAKTASVIPFRVTTQQRVAKALHFKRDPAPEQVAVKMMRDAATSPDGRWLVFSAVGQLWKKKLPQGEPVRLTRSSGVNEYYPSFSPDGKWVVYVSWSDTELAAIRKVKLSGGKSIKLTQEKGYYYNPRFSPDGREIVFRKGTGNAVLGFTHGLNPGIYLMSANGGSARLLTEEGREPRFDASGRRVYFITGGGMKKAYKSIGTDGTKPRTLFDLKYVNHIVPSPDDNWVAFTELHNAYIAPFPKTGRAIALNKDTKAIPVARVTRDAGHYLHWSGDSRKLHWMIGPEYFTRELERSFAFIEGAPDTLPPPDSTGLAVQLKLPADVPRGTVAFTNARLITMEGDQVIEKGTLIVKGNKIAALGRAGEVTVPEGAEVIDLTGKTIIPGLIDVHAHANHFYSGLLPRQSWAYFANLAYGVTTMHDPSTNTETVFTQAEMVRTGAMVGPRVFSTGQIIYGADGDFKSVINSLDDARSHLRRLKAVGAFSVKSYNQPRRNQRQQVIQAARELQMEVVPEGGSTFFHNMSMILDGHTGIEHNVPIATLYDDVIRLWAASGTGYTPTLVVSYGSVSGEYYWYQHSEVWKKMPLMNFIPRPIVDARSRRRQMLPEDDFGHVLVSQSAKRLADAGVKVNLGAHGQLQGLGAHWELWMLAQGGLTPMQALRSATMNGAYYLGMEDHLGSLKPGKLADLVVLERNPLEDIHNTEYVKMVMVNGRLYDSESMDEIGNHPRKRGPFYWENPKTSEAFIWRGPGLGFELPGCGCATGLQEN